MKKWHSYIFLLLFIVGLGFVIYLFLDTPVLKMRGNSNITLEVFSEYQDEGATARTFLQNLDSKVKTEGTVDTNKLGNYEITYSVSGVNGSSSIVRFVSVVDTTPPEITLKGEETISVCPGKEYAEEGFEAMDNYDGDLTEQVKVERQDEKIIYQVTDSSNNETIKERTIVYEDKSSPSIVLKGDKEYHIKRSEPYREPGFTVIDDCESSQGNVEITGYVDVNTQGVYPITYRIKDNAGNEASVTRTVYVD